MLSELRTNSVGDGPLVEVGCGRQLFAFAERAVRPPDGTEDGEPELLCVLLVAPHLDDRHPVPLTRPVRPGPQQRGLPTARGARDKRYLASRRAVEGSQKFPALNQPRSLRTRLSLPTASQHPVHV